MSNRSLLAVIATVGVLAACLSSAVMAKPANPKDFVGKKLCWSFPTASANCANGTDTFSTFDKYNSTCFGDVTCHGRHCVGSGGPFDRQIEKLPDGTFKLAVIHQGVTYEGTGHFCQ